MKITKETDHAVKCVLYLSKIENDFVSVSEISKKNDIPKSFLAKIIQKLTKAEILISQQGKQGGFKLARDPHTISLYEVFESIQGCSLVSECVIEENYCTRDEYCPVHQVWGELRDHIVEKMKSRKFDDMAAEETENLKNLQTQKCKGRTVI